MNMEHVADEYRAYQQLRSDLVAVIEHMEPAIVSQSELSRRFGITPTVLRRLRSARRVRPVRKSHRRNARLRYRLREVLLPIVRDGVYGTGRIRNGVDRS